MSIYASCDDCGTDISDEAFCGDCGGGAATLDVTFSNAFTLGSLGANNELKWNTLGNMMTMEIRCLNVNSI